MAENSVFDPEAFVNMTTTETSATKYTPIPEADYVAFCRKMEMVQVVTKDGPRLVCRLTWQIDDPELALKMNRQPESLTCRQDMWLDLSEDGKSLLFGDNHNVQLGRTREACGLNAPGKPFNFRMFEGQGPVLVHVKHRPDKDDPSVVYDGIDKVAKFDPAKNAGGLAPKKSAA